MPDAAPQPAAKKPAAALLLHLKQTVLGLVQDFWADGHQNPLAALRLPVFKLPSLGRAGKNAPAVGQVPGAHGKAGAGAAKSKDGKPLWHAEPGEVSEKMFGAGFVTPGGEAMWEALINPLGIDKSMNVLDLSAGLGGRMRKVAETFGAYITGLEPDRDVAARGMELSVHAHQAKHAPVAHYEAATFHVEHTYDCILARETFYRVADQPAFFKKLSEVCKPKAQLAFTDYIVDRENRDKPAVVAWLAFEKGANPYGLVEMATAWAKVGVTLRVNEDLTATYTGLVADGLKRLAAFLATGMKPDAETKKTILRRIELWTHRMAAMEQGMKFYRFYATKP